MPATSSVSPTGNPYVDGLLAGTKWAVGNLTFSFPASATFYESGYGQGEPQTGFESFNAQQQSATRAALQNFSAVSNVTFSEIAESTTIHGDLRFAESDVPSTAWAYLPSTRPEGGDVWLNNSRNYYDAPLRGNYAYATLLHEVGHAMGLKHPHEASGSFPALPSRFDALEYTVMSYRSYQGGPTTGYTNEGWGYPQSLMISDIAALQTLYGANYSFNSSDTNYRWSPTTGEMSINGVGQGAPGANKIFLTVWDGGGTDTYDFSAYTSNISANLMPGEWTTTSANQLARLSSDGSQLAEGNIANAMLFNYDERSLIENAVGGSGNDTIIGNAAANYLQGGLGNDRLFGGGGNDQLAGGRGSDFLHGDGGFDTALFDFSIHNASMDYGSAAMLISSSEGQDSLKFVEQMQFSDGAVLQADGTWLVDDMFYFTRNDDVFNARIDAEQHYSHHGWREGRDPNKYFDSSDYLAVYRDVAAAGMNPLDHYSQHGWLEGRDPSRSFDTEGYLSLYGDVAAAGMNPLTHYLSNGVYEGRAVVDDGMFG